VRSRPIIASANRKRTQPRTFNVDTAICLNHMSAHQKIEWRLGTEAPFFKGVTEETWASYGFPAKAGIERWFMA